MALKVILFSTSQYSSNGYSAVTTALISHLAEKKDIELTHWAFQAFPSNPQHREKRAYPSNVQVFDAWANEKLTEPNSLGFGFTLVKDFVDMNKPDVLCIYNDMVVVSNILEQLKKCEYKNFKVIVYFDQVYLTQRKEFIQRLNNEADFVMCFTPYWEECAKGQGLTKPSDFLQHGFDPMKNYPVPKKLARLHFGLKQEDFIVINTCRNVPRKKYDTMMQCWAEFVSRHRGEPVKFLIATHPTQGSWNLIELYEHELRIREMTLEEGMKHIILIDNPQQLTDEDLNTLYNTADVGINTCQGAGFELTTHEHGGIGIAQIATFTGGIRDFLDKDCGTPITPCITGYTDMNSDGCNGKYEQGHPNDFADALDAYYADDEYRLSHGKKMRENILKNYKWADIGEKLYNIIKKVYGPVSQLEQTNVNLIDIGDLNLTEDIVPVVEKVTDIVKETPIAVPVAVEVPVPASVEVPAPVPAPVEVAAPVPAPVEVPAAAPATTKVPPQVTQQKKKDEIKSRLLAKLAEKKANKVVKTKITVVEESDSDSDKEVSVEKLLKMKKNIEKMLEKKQI